MFDRTVTMGSDTRGESTGDDLGLGAELAASANRALGSRGELSLGLVVPAGLHHAETYNYLRPLTEAADGSYVWSVDVGISVSARLFLR